MNIQNLGSKGSVGVKYKGGICAELFVKFWFKGTDISVILLSQDGSESDCPEKSANQSLVKVCSEAAVRNLQQENTCVGVSFQYSFRPESLNFMIKVLRHRFFPVNITKFLKAAFFIEHLRWLCIIIIILLLVLLIIYFILALPFYMVLRLKLMVHKCS